MKWLLQIGLLLMGLASCVPAKAAITCVQGTTGCTTTTQRTATGTATSLNITVGATVIGDLGIMCVSVQSTGTGVLNASSSGGTWSVVAASLSRDGGINGFSECAWVVFTSAVTTINCPISVSTAFDCEFYQFHSSLGTWTLDAGGAIDDTVNCTACNGVVETTLVTNANGHVLVQNALVTNSITSITTPTYTTNVNGTTGDGGGYRINVTTSGGTPKFNQTSGKAAVGGIGVYETSAGSTFRTQIGGMAVGF